MSETISTRTPAPGAVALALLTVLALLVAPVCATICAASICPAGISQGQCLDMASMGANESSRFAPPSRACSGADLSAVLVNANDTLFRLQELWMHSAPVTMPAAIGRSFASLRTIPGRGRPHRVLSASLNLPLLAAILRI
ncbi:MAG: hypothetical protein WA765_17235 [Candidatus Acidiferrum sp.]